MAKVLPSDIARLVLAYLQDNDLKGTSQKFLEESPHLSEIRNNPECPVLPPQMKDLETLMEEHAVFIQEGKKRRQASPVVIQLWKKLDTVVAQLKYEYLEEKPEGWIALSRRAKARQSLESLRLRQMQREQGNCISNSSGDVPSTASESTRPHQSNWNSQTSTCSVPVISPKRKSVTPRKKRSQEDHVPVSQPPTSDVPLNPEELIEFPQILESLLSDTTLPEKLAGAINKVLPPGDLSPRRLDLQNDSGLSSAVAAEQRQPVDKRAVEEAIEMTCSDPAFASLFSLFNVDREKFLEDEKKKALQGKNSDEIEKFRDSGRRIDGGMSAAVARDLFPSSSTSEQDVTKSTDDGTTGERHESEVDQGSVESNRTSSKQLDATHEERKGQNTNVERSRDEHVPETLSPSRFQPQDEAMDVNGDGEDVIEEVHSISDDTSRSPFPRSDNLVTLDSCPSDKETTEIERHSSESAQRASAFQNEDETRRGREETARGKDTSQEPQSKKITGKDASRDFQRKENYKASNLHFERADKGKATSNLDPLVDVETGDMVCVGKGPKPELGATVSKGKKGEGGKKTRRRDRYKDSQATRRSQRLEAKKQQTSASVNSPCSTIEDEDEQHSENPRTPSQMNTTERGLQAANEYAKKLLASMPGKGSGGALDGLSPVALNVTVTTASPRMECLPDPFEKGTLLSTTTRSLTDCRTVASLTHTTSSVLSTRQNSEITITKSIISKGKVTVLSPSGRQVGDIKVERSRRNDEDVTGEISPGNNGNRCKSKRSQSNDALVDDGSKTLHTVSNELRPTTTDSDGTATSAAGVTAINVSDKMKRTVSTGNEVVNTQIVSIPLQYVQVATNLATNATNFAITPGQHQQALQKNGISVSQSMDLSSEVPHLTVFRGTSLDQNVPANSNLVVCSSGDPENPSKQVLVSDTSGDWGNDSQVIMLQAADSLLSLGVVADTVTPLASSDPKHQRSDRPLVALQNVHNSSQNSHRQTVEATSSSDVIQNVPPTSHVLQSVSGSVDQSSGNRCLSDSVNMAPELLSSQDAVTTTIAAAQKASHHGGGNHLNLDQQGVSMLMNEELERSLQNASTQDIDFIFKAITMTPQKDVKKDGVRNTVKDSKKYSPLEKAIADKLKMFTGSEYQTKADERKVKEKVSPWKNAALQSQSRSARNKKCVRKVFADEGVEPKHPCGERSVRDKPNSITRPGESDVESTWQNGSGLEKRLSYNTEKYSDRIPLPNNVKSLENKGGVNSTKYENGRSLQDKEGVVREKVLENDTGEAVFRTSGKEDKDRISKLSGKPQKKCNKKGADGMEVRVQKRKIKDIIDQEKQQKLERRMTTRLKESHLGQRNGKRAEESHEIGMSSRRHQHGNSTSPSQHLGAMRSNHDDQSMSANQDARNDFEDKSRAARGSSFARIDRVGVDVKASQEMNYSVKGGEEHSEGPSPASRDFARETRTRVDGVLPGATVELRNHERFADSHEEDDKSARSGARRKVSEKERGHPAKRKDDGQESVTNQDAHSQRQQSKAVGRARLCQKMAERNYTDKCNTVGNWDHSTIESRDVVGVDRRLVSSNEAEDQSGGEGLSGIRGQREKYPRSDQTEIHRVEDKYLDRGRRETGHSKGLGHRRSRSAVERAATGNVTKARSNSHERIRVLPDRLHASCHGKPTSRHSPPNFSGSQGPNRNESPPSGNDQTQAEIDFMRKDYENETSYNVNPISEYEAAKSGSTYRPAPRRDGRQSNVTRDELNKDRRRQSSIRGNSDESDREERHSVDTLSSSPISVTSMSPRESWKTESDYLRESCSRTRGYHSHKQKPDSHSSVTELTTKNAANGVEMHQPGEQSNVSLLNTQNSTRKKDYGMEDGGGRSFDTSERHHWEQEQLPAQFNDPRVPFSKEKSTARKCHSAYDERLQVRRHAGVSDENMVENLESRKEPPEKRRSFGKNYRSSRRRSSPRWEQLSHNADSLGTEEGTQEWGTRDSGRFSMEGLPPESKRHVGGHRHHAKGDISLYRGNKILDQDGRFSSVNRFHDSGRHSPEDQRLIENASDECEDVGNPSLRHAGDFCHKLPFDGAFRKPMALSMDEKSDGPRCQSDFWRENNSIDEEYRVLPFKQHDHRYLDSRMKYSRLSSQVERLEHSERHYSQDTDHRMRARGERPREFAGNYGKTHSDTSFNFGEERGDASVRHSSSEKLPTGVCDRPDPSQGHYNSWTKAPAFNRDRLGGEWTERRHSHDGRLSVNSRVSLDQNHSERSSEASRKQSRYEDSREITEIDSGQSDLRYSDKNELSSYRNPSEDHSFHQRTHTTKITNSLNLRDETRSHWEDIGAKEKAPPSSSAGRENNVSQATSSRNVKRRLQETDNTRPASSAKRKKSSKEPSPCQEKQPLPAGRSGDTLPSEFDLQKFLARLKYA